MSNMSYCRFENTYHDLMDCKRALYEEGLDDLSDSERRCAKNLIEVCSEIIDVSNDFESDD